MGDSDGLREASIRDTTMSKDDDRWFLCDRLDAMRKERDDLAGILRMQVQLAERDFSEIDALTKQLENVRLHLSQDGRRYTDEGWEEMGSDD